MAAESLNKTIPKKRKRQPTKAVTARRAIVSGMMMRHVTQGKIAIALGVGKTTITSDVKALEADWRGEMVSNITNIKARELAELSAIEAEAWIGFGRSRPKLSEAQVKAKVPLPAGDPKWLKVLLDVKKRRSDLLGLDAPIEVRHGLMDMDLCEMNDDELTELENQLASGLVGDEPVLH